MSQIESYVTAVLCQLPAGVVEEEMSIVVEVSGNQTVIDLVIGGVLIAMAGLAVGVTLATVLS